MSVNNFYNVDKLGAVSINTYAQEFQNDSTISSDGAFALDLYNMGDTPLDLIINSVHLLMMEPANIGGAIVPSPTSHIHLPGSPGVNRDDYIEIEFGKFQSERKLIVLYHRVIYQDDPIDFVARQRTKQSKTT